MMLNIFSFVYLLSIYVVLWSVCLDICIHTFFGNCLFYNRELTILFILDRIHSLHISIVSISTDALTGLFILLRVSLTEKKFSIFNNLSFFSFKNSSFHFISKRFLPNSGLCRFPPINNLLVVYSLTFYIYIYDPLAINFV